MLEVRHAEEIARRFDLGRGAVLSGPIARGEQGQVWRLATSRGVWAVKEPFEPAPEIEAREAAALQEAAAARGVHVPTVERSTEGAIFAAVDGVSVRIYGWVDLRARDASIDPAEVGRIVASIHGVRLQGQCPLDQWYTDPVGADRWEELVLALTKAGAPFARRLADYRHELVAMEELIESPTCVQTCHRDLWADNILRTTTGDLCVIDWEDCGLADPSQELAFVLFEFGGTDAARARALYEAYRAGGGPGRIDRRGHFSMVIAQLGHIGEIACRNWLEPTARGAERHRSAARADEFLDDRRLTRAVIDRLLEAVTA